MNRQQPQTSHAGHMGLPRRCRGMKKVRSGLLPQVIYIESEYRII